MKRREEYETAFAEAVVNLARAEADLGRAVAGHARAELNPGEGDVDRVRAACRKARAELAQLNREAPPPASNERDRHLEERPGRPPRKPTRIRKLLRAFRGLHAVDRATPDWRLIARQSLMLLALVLAYLQYYFFDVQLEVLRLPSVALLLG